MLDAPGLCPFCQQRPAQIWRDAALFNCKPCAQTALRTQAALQQVAHWVRDRITQLTGHHFQAGSITVNLVEITRFQNHFGPDTGGQAQSWLEVHPEGTTIYRESAIWLPYGLPVAHAIWTLAHELGHVLAAQRRLQFTDQMQEEGFCQALAYAVSEHSQNTLMPEIRQREWSRSDTLYGLSLRQEFTRLKQLGWPNYLNQFQSQEGQT